MKYILESNIPDHSFCIETNRTYKETDVEDIMSDLKIEIGELLLEIYQKIEYKPLGNFDEDKVEKELYEFVENFISEHVEEYCFISRTVYADGQVKETKIPIDTDLLAVLEMDSQTENFSEAAGEYVESCLMEYVDKSQWNIGFITEDEFITEEEIHSIKLINSAKKLWLVNGLECNPCIWYGVPGEKPNKPWLITENTSDQSFSFWFTVEPWNVLEELGNFSELFLIWYCGECVRECPDPTDIRSICPIPFTEDDTVNSLMRKVGLYFQKDKAPKYQ